MAAAEIIAGVGALSNAITIVKTLREADKAYDQASLRLQLADLLDKLADGKVALVEARQELDAAESQI